MFNVSSPGVCYGDSSKMSFTWDSMKLLTISVYCVSLTWKSWAKLQDMTFLCVFSAVACCYRPDRLHGFWDLFGYLVLICFYISFFVSFPFWLYMLYIDCLSVSCGGAYMLRIFFAIQNGGMARVTWPWNLFLNLGPHLFLERVKVKFCPIWNVYLVNISNRIHTHTHCIFEVITKKR